MVLLLDHYYDMITKDVVYTYKLMQKIIKVIV
jgi:hypothetical protein